MKLKGVLGLKLADIARAENMSIIIKRTAKRKGDLSFPGPSERNSPKKDGLEKF